MACSNEAMPNSNPVVKKKPKSLYVAVQKATTLVGLPQKVDP
jgi:hypothetical protein